MADVLQHLVQAIRGTAGHNPEVQVSPMCIIWPDGDRQWEPVAARLQAELPEMFILGDYDFEKKTGPAIWLRCLIANKVPNMEIPKDSTPILYLPGVSRQDLRAVESCSDHLKALAELQYRGVIWSQISVKDWTIPAFLKSDQGGLGLNVAQDTSTENAIQLALYRLLDEDIELLNGKHLDKDYFNTLLTSGDPVRDLLQWLDHAETFRAGLDSNEWRAFVEVCKSQLAFNPENEGILAGAAKLAAHIGPWRPVWVRFCEAPRRYLNIPAQIQKCQAPLTTFFSDAKDYSGWPQWNEANETMLRKDLQSLSSVPPHEARELIAKWQKSHHDRKNLVWAELGESPLALALEHLAILAETTSNALAAGTVEDLAAGYSNAAWRGDDSVIRALAYVEKQEDWEAVTTAIRSVYLPWAEESARYLQDIVYQTEYPGGLIPASKDLFQIDGQCILFVDGLRFDTARQLVTLLSERGYQIEETLKWTAIPSVTATGKPAVAPVSDKIRGQEANIDFEPSVADTGQSLKDRYHFKKLLTDAGWKVLERYSNGDGHGNAWCEFGNIDHEGHVRGWKLAKCLDSMLNEIRERIAQLLKSGWKTVCIVTDHGWLLMPGGLPKIDLPSALTENKWRRCAVIKEGAVTDERLYPWHWNPSQRCALADGISCYRNGEEYTHGGLSLQECLVLELTVSSGASRETGATLEITDIVWKGLRCTVYVDGEFSGLSLDIRTHPGNASSSVAVGVKPFKGNGTASVIVEDAELRGTLTTLVVIDSEGKLVAQGTTVIGGDTK